MSNNSTERLGCISNLKNIFSSSVNSTPLPPLEECARLSTRLRLKDTSDSNSSLNVEDDRGEIFCLLKNLSPSLFASCLEQAGEGKSIRILNPSLPDIWLEVVQQIDSKNYCHFATYGNGRIEAQSDTHIEAAKLFMKAMSINKIITGNSNHIYTLLHSSLPNGQVLLRLYGNLSDAMDREREMISYALMSDRNLSAKILFCFKWGRVEKYLVNSTTLTAKLVNSSPFLLSRIYEGLAMIHKIPFYSLLPQTLNKYIPESNELSCDTSPEDYYRITHAALVQILKESKSKDSYYTYEMDAKVMESTHPSGFERMCFRYLRHIDVYIKKELKIPFQQYWIEEIKWVHSQLRKFGVPLVFSHNDVNNGNILLVSDSSIDDVTKNKMFFVDFEYSDVNYRCFDIGNVICELDYEYTPKSTVGFIKPFFQNRDVGDELPMEYPRLPKLMYECWKNATHMSSGHLSLHEKAIHGIKRYFNLQANENLEAIHLIEVFLGMLCSHLFFTLWSIAMCKGNGNSSVGSAGLDYVFYAKCRANEYEFLKKWLAEISLLD